MGDLRTYLCACCGTKPIHATSVVSLPNLVAFAMLTTILDPAEGYDVREEENVSSHRVTIEARPRQMPNLSLTCLRTKPEWQQSILRFEIKSCGAPNTLHVRVHELPEEI